MSEEFILNEGAAGAWAWTLQHGTGHAGAAILETLVARSGL
jgi:hypothetical protein